jgi:hypothetical protein
LRRARKVVLLVDEGTVVAGDAGVGVAVGEETLDSVGDGFRVGTLASA